MSTAAGRKKSIISGADNTVLNKAASQSTSLYQQCSALRTRLMRVQDFSDFFSLSSQPEGSSSRRSTDPVTQLWDLFSLGVPLCYLFNLLPGVQPLDVETANFDPTNDKTRKRGIAMFAMGLRQLEGCGTFTVTDLWDRASTDGFVKVVNIITDVVDRLPEEAFSDLPPSSPPLFSPKDSSDSLPAELFASGSQEYPGSQVVTELLHTERKFVQDLETMQRYATAAAESNTIDQDTIHLLFPGLNKLLNFQRRFLIRLESIWELPWNERHWGSPFIEFEEEFVVYEPYCANYTTASEIMLTEEHHLSALDHILNVKSELPAFLIKPVQRICKYPLLLESLVKVLNGKEEYSYLEELKAGVAAAKRITDRINEEQRRAENKATVKSLEGRVEDWKGHHISNFGALLLDDIFTVTKSEMDREYHVFLFEKIILCCKEYTPTGPNAKKVSKSNSILKKPAPPPLNIPFGQSGSKKRNTPLLLKGRIFLNNVTSAVPKGNAGQYSLAVYWKGDDDLEYFTLRCRNEEQLRQWENQLNRLIQDAVARRNSDGRVTGAPMRFTHMPNSTSPAPTSGRHHPYGSERTFSMFSQTTSASATGSSLPSYPAPYGSRGSRYPSSATSEDTMSGHGPQGYPPYDGFDVDPEDDYEDYPVAASVPHSGRVTPMGSRRHNIPEGYSTVRGAVSPQPPTGPYPPHSMSNGRPGSTRTSQAPEQRPTLRSQFSSNRLRPDRPESRASAHSPQPPPPFPSQRSRSASQPSAFIPRTAPPPLPTTLPWAERAQNQNGDSKRGSSSSQSTGDNSSDYSPNSGSPITPFGSSDSSLAGMAGSMGRSHHEKVLSSATQQLELSVPVKVKVHFHEDIFVIQVPRLMEYEELVERVGKKIRLCGPRRDDGPLRVKYKDEDGDLVSLGSTEDVQMAFESFRPGSQVTLYVQ